MATLYVNYCSRIKLPCTGALVQDVILCLEDAALVVPTSCPAPSEATFEGAFAEATICQWYNNGDCSNPTIWTYTFSYDDAILADAAVPLQSADITGVFCKDCLFNYLDNKIGDESYVVTNDDNTQSFISQHGCVYPLVVTEQNLLNCEYVASQYGGYTDTAITAALAAIGVNEATLYIDCGDWDIANNLTLPANVNVEILAGALLDVAAAKTLTFSGPTTIPLSQVFTDSSSVLFSVGTVEYVSPQWWGAVPDGVVDCSTAINKAIVSLPSTGGCVVLPNGLLSVESQINVTQYGVLIRGAAPVEDNGRTEIRYTGAVDSTASIIRCTAAAQGFCLANVFLNANDLAGYCVYQVGDPTPLNTRGGRFDSITFQGYRSKGWVIGDHTDTLNPAQFQIINAYDLKFTGGGNSLAADAIHVNAQNMEFLNIFGIYIDPESTNVRHHRNHIRHIAGGLNIVGMLSTRAGSSALTTYPAIYSNDQLLIHGWRSEDRWLISGAAGEAGGPIHIVGLDQRSPTEPAAFTVIEINWLERPVHIQGAVDGSITIGATNERICTLDIQFKKVGAGFVFAGPQNQRGIYRDLETGDVKHMGSAPALDLLYQDGTRRWAVVDGSLFEIRTTLAQITSNQNNYTLPAGIVFRLSADAARDITGFAGTGPGRHVRLFNVGANAITLKYQNAGSSASNRIISTSGADIVLAQHEGAELWWDITEDRWRAWKL
jgi:hypothetical protein